MTLIPRIAPPPASEEAVLTFLKSEFPNTNFKRAAINDQGWDNLVVEVDGEWIFRFPKDGEYRYEQEQLVLEALRDKVKIPIPRIEFLGHSRWVMGYRKIQGQLVPENEWASWPDEKIRLLAADLAGFLWDCHRSLSAEQAKSWGLPRQTLADRYLLVKDRLPELARFGVEKFARRALEEYGALGDGERESFLYNDLHTENFVVNTDGRLGGIFDFGDCRWGDPNQEFPNLYRYGPRLFESCVAEYERLSGLSINKRVSVVHGWVDSLFDLAELWDKPENGAHKNALRWLTKFMKTPEDYR